jgi:hypothetical protein
MQEKRNDSEIHLMVTGTKRDGRRRYDLQSKRELARACLFFLLASMPGTQGVAGVAQRSPLPQDVASVFFGPGSSFSP